MNNNDSVPNLRRKTKPLHRLINAANGSSESRDDEGAGECGSLAQPLTLENFRESLLGNRD